MNNIHEIVSAKDAEGFAVDDDFVEAVEERIGMGASAWDTIEPKLICSEVIAEFLNRYKVNKQ